DEAQQIVTREPLHVLDRPRDRPRQRMPRPHGQVEELVDEFVRRVLDLTDLLRHDAALALDLLAREQRLREDVREHVERRAQVLGQYLRPVAGVLLAGEGVDRSPDAVDRLRDLSRRAPGGALEEQVLEEVREAGLLRRLVAGSVLDPDADGDRWAVRQL